ncbi:uncharacterized protein LOC132307988 [Cornus florida]|uniref:uncharacterized protein LOC132307988 n=1 Tax=Cornus florida TaxID=4283 RepID=UPI00289D51B3|nr:uncharacterized protein LOC132307988 [Cornus florida]
MSMQSWSLPNPLQSPSPRSFSRSRNRRNVVSNGELTVFLRRKPKTFFSSLKVGIDEIADIAHNKVLIAAAVSAAIGQLSKPFTSAILYDNKNGFNFKAVFQAGGFPSTHSSAVVATATSLGLERGFSDAIFGLAVVYASLVMYDAQGVRREVGTHAKALNRVLLKAQLNSISSNDLVDSQPGKLSSNLESLDPSFSKEASLTRSKPTNASLLLRSDNRINQCTTLIPSGLAADVDGELEKVVNSGTSLNESVGHTVFEVIAGALLGLFVSLVVYTVT